MLLELLAVLLAVLLTRPSLPPFFVVLGGDLRPVVHLTSRVA